MAGFLVLVGLVLHVGLRVFAVYVLFVGLLLLIAVIS